MPPHVPRNKLRNASPAQREQTPRKDKGKDKATLTRPRKRTLFDDLDENSGSPSSRRDTSALQHLEQMEDDDSSLSSLSDVEFEDVHVSKRPKLAEPDESDDEDIEFEDVEMADVALPDGPQPSGDLELTLIKDSRISLTNPFGDKKGPSKRERMVRNATHCVHVMSLMWHNAVRNSWLCDPELQGIMVSHLPRYLSDEVEKWRRNSGLEASQEKKAKGKQGTRAAGRKSTARPPRDWGDAATRLEEGAVDMSHGDPLFRLMNALSAWWKKRFTITAPGTRKMGYMSLERLDRLTKSFLAGEQDPRRFGERVPHLEALREHAQRCAGSRDVGAQLFTALLRGLGLEARMVANLQPLGFGWNKMEDADPEDDAKGNDPGTSQPAKPEADVKVPDKSSKSRSGRKVVITISDDDESDVLEPVGVDSDDDVVMEMPQVATKKTSVTYDKDLAFPHYWTEVLSPVTNKYLVVDALVKSVVGTNRELIESLEPRGVKADRARQVIAYVVGFSPDGTAKDITVRYLKRQVLPGRTKGSRMPVARIPIYNKHGKVARYEELDWFKQVMSGYVRGSRKHPITEVDEEENATDLKPAQPQKKEMKEGEETLQYYKQSKEFVLARHLKREEALLPDAQPVRVFRSKGNKGGEASEENVYRRKDVVNVKSAETWHKQGRAPIDGEEPLKRAPYRAATTNRRREIAETERATGEKALQGLYSFDQTDWIIPPPIRNGVIPKNEYGNIDLFAEHMCPKGAAHVPYRGAVKVCKRIGIDFAEAVIDFEFGHRMAVPVIQGVVIAEEYHDQVMQELAKDEAERSRKEDEKRRAAAMGMWRKMIMGLRIVKRIQEEYGEIEDDQDVFGHSHEQSPRDKSLDGDDVGGGGFLPEGYVEDEGDDGDDGEAANQKSSFFPVVDDDEEDDDGEDGLIIEDDRLHVPAHSTPQSETGIQPEPQRAVATRSSRRRG